MLKRLKNRHNLRTGYTTGACAASAARAAAMALLRQKNIDQVQITLPGGSPATFKVNRCMYDSAQASCFVLKDAGDDPDITDGIEIWAAAAWSQEPGVHIEGGLGVGIVTKPGLEIAIGLPAINPVPRRMITSEVSSVAGDRLSNQGLEIKISVPEGIKLAKKTLNPRLGIVGGISILGTTGIVIPYSVDAYTASISQAMDVAAAVGCREVVLTTGRRSEKFAQGQLALAEESFVQAGDFIGFSLQECQKKHFHKVIIWGMTGKISKLANGHLYTNISDSDMDTPFLVGIARDCGVPEPVLELLKQAVSANHIRELLPAEYLEAFAGTLCRLAAQKCCSSINGALEVECIMTDYEGAILGRAGVKE